MEKSRQNPLPVPPPSAIFQDISNLRTPARKTPLRSDPCSQFQSPNPGFFTASKETPLPPSSIRRPSQRSVRSLSRASSAASRRLKAFEIEQSKSSRKAHVKKEKALRTLAKSLTTWLNFLLGNPSSCGCSVLKDERMDLVGFDFFWRCPKRRKSENWEESGGGRGLGGVSGSFSGLSGSARFGRLKSSLNEICSLEDLEERMRGYMSLGGCEEVFEAMMLVAKSIDEGRLKMKAHCPIVTDFGMKEKAVKALLSYNPVWLRIGLYIIQGGDSLLPKGDVNLDGDNAFLKLIIEKQFLAHAGLAKSHAYNKNVEGLYRPGYYESLGKVILKRFLLLVLILDRVKTESSLPLRYGIDGLDGGSPLLFLVQSGIKSSPQVVSDFLTGEVMHGEGNILVHLAILSFKVSHQQLPLMEYDFSLRDVVEDLQDGMRLCRAIQLLKQETSILMKLLVPADTQKKTLANCGWAMRYIKQFGVPLEDDDGVTITADDVNSGDKELTVSLLWNIFVHLQLPLLVDKATLTEEIHRINVSSLKDLSIANSTPLEILLRWIQSICHGYNLEIVNLQSLTDGKAIWCLLDFYFRKELHCSCLSEDGDITRGRESIVSATQYTDAVHNFALSQKLSSLLGDFPEVLQLSDILEQHGVCDGRCVAILLSFFASHLLVKKNMDQLNFHKLLNCSCQSIERRNFCKQRVLIPLKLVTCKEEVDQCSNGEGASKFKAIRAWWQSMTEQNFSRFKKPVNSIADVLSISQPHDVRERENAATIIQSHYRRLVGRRWYLKIVNAVIMLQIVTRVWLLARHKMFLGRNFALDMEKYLSGRGKNLEMSGRYMKFLFDRHYFITMKSSALLVQRAIKIWIARKKQNEDITSQMASTHLNHGDSARQGLGSTTESIQDSCLDLSKEISSKMKQENAATIIQSHYRRLIVRGRFLKIIDAVILIQNVTRAWLMVRPEKLLGRNFSPEVEKYSYGRGRCFKMSWRYVMFVSDRHEFIKMKNSALLIQRTVRNWIAQKQQEEEIRSPLMVSIHLDHETIAQQYLAGFSLDMSLDLYKGVSFQVMQEIAAKQIQLAWRNHYHQNLCHSSATRIQCWLRGWLSRKEYNKQKGAALTIQCNYRRYRSWKSLEQARVINNSALVIQSHARGFGSIRIWIARKKPNEVITSQMVPTHLSHGDSARQGLGSTAESIQDSCLDLCKEMSSKMKQENAATIIQSHYRRLIVRGRFLKIIDAVILIQNVTRAWLMVRPEKLLGRNFSPEVEKYSYGRGRCFEMSRRYVMFVFDRHEFIKMKYSALLIQRSVRNWIAQKQQGEEIRSPLTVSIHLDHETIAQQYLAGFGLDMSLDLYKGVNSQVMQEIAAKQIQFAWRNHYHQNLCYSSATKIQCWLRGWLSRKEYNKQKGAALTIQCNYRRYRSWKSLEQARVINNSALVIQSHARGWIARRSYRRFRSIIVQIQSCCRGWLTRRKFLALQEAVITIQRFIRGQISQKRLTYAKILLSSAVRIQRWWRSIMLHRLRVQSARVIQSCARELIAWRRASKERLRVVSLVIRLQKRWKNILSHRLRVKSAIIIQSYARGFIARKIAARERHCVVHIQSFWKGYIARKESRDQVQEACLRVQKAATNVDDSRRLINRLRAALSELLNMRSVSSILHTCATLDMATRHSEKCCEELVEAGAIDKLLKLIPSMTRSVPDQEVLKHALSTLRNITRFPRLLDDLVSTSGSAEIILWELLRSKEDAFFIASETLKKVFSMDKGREAIRRLPALLKRMNALIGELSKRPQHDRNNARAAAAKENAERRLKEAVELASLISQ